MSAPDFRHTLSSAPHILPDAVWQLFRQGPTADGNLISKSERDKMVSIGYADRAQGWNWLTSEGVRFALDLGMGADTEKRPTYWHPTEGPKP